MLPLCGVNAALADLSGSASQQKGAMNLTQSVQIASWVCFSSLALYSRF